MPADPATRDASRGPGSWGAETLLLGALTAGALFGRLLQSRESLWLDELHTAWTTLGALSEVVERAAVGNHSPPFFWIEWLVARALGPDELSLRLVSLIAGAALLPLVFAVVRAWTDSAWLALLAAGLLALDPQATYYATEARPYALVQVIAVAHVACFERLVRHPSGARRAMMIVGGAVLVHLHYTAALVLAAELAWYLWRRRAEHPAYAIGPLATDLAILAFTLLPAFWLLPSLVSRRGLWALWVDQQSLWEGLRMIPWGTTAVLAVAAGAAARRFLSVPSHPPAGSRPPQSLVVAWLVLPVVLAWVATATDTARLLAPRYLAGSAPAAVVLLALALRALPSRHLRLAAGLGVALVATTTSPTLRGLVTDGRMLSWRTDDWRSVVAYFNGHPGHREGIVMLRSLLIECDARDVSDTPLASYCLYPITSTYLIDAAPERLEPVARGFDGELAPTLRSRVESDGSAWIILQGASTTADGVEHQMVRSLSLDSGSRWTVRDRRSFGTVHILRITRSPEAEGPGV